MSKKDEIRFLSLAPARGASVDVGRKNFRTLFAPFFFFECRRSHGGYVGIRLAYTPQPYLGFLGSVMGIKLQVPCLPVTCVASVFRYLEVWADLYQYRKLARPDVQYPAASRREPWALGERGSTAIVYHGTFGTNLTATNIGRAARRRV